MPIPDRTTDGDYHYHVYDYIGSQPFQPSAAQPRRGNTRFFSLVADLNGLVQEGQQVPNIALTNAGGAAITDDGVARYTKALSFGAVAHGTPEIVITGGIHAREWIASEMAYLLAEYLIKNYPDPQTPDLNLSRYQLRIRRIINGRRIHIIPMLNPAGNRYSVFSPDDGARLWRRNRHPLPTTALGWSQALTTPLGGPVPPFQNVQTNNNVTSYQVPRYLAAATLDTINLPNAPPAITGVDLNRNLGTNAYGHNCAPSFRNGTPGQDVYFGPGAASEVETQNLQAFLAPKNVETSIDYHSYGQYILYPSELSNTGAVTANFINLGKVLQRLIAGSWSWPWSYDYSLGPARTLVGYDATGTVDDYIGQQHGSRSFTIELDPTSGVFSSEFELPESKIRTVFEKNIRGALGLMTAAGQQSALATTTSCCCFKRQTISSNERVLVDWNVYGRGNLLPV